MTRYYLTQIEVEGFRGINNENDPLEVKFKPNAINSVFAANGLGKSSLFEALSYAITGSVPKLDRIAAAEMPREYYCNRFHSKNAAKVTLRFLPDEGGKEVIIDVLRTVDGKRLVSSPSGYSDPDSLLRSLDQDTVLLDNYTFGKFLADSPLERGKTFSSLLGLSQLSQARQALEMVSDTRAYNTDFGIRVLESEITTGRDQSLTALRSLRQDYLTLLAQQLPEPLDLKATGIAAAGALSEIPLLKDLFTDTDFEAVDFDKVSSLIKDAERSDDQDRLKKILQDLTRLEDLSATADENAEQQQLEAAFGRKEAALGETRGASFKSLYEAVKRVLTDGSWQEQTACPACESTPTVPPPQFIEKQLEQYQLVRTAEENLLKTWRSLNWPLRLRKLENEPVLRSRGNAEGYQSIQGAVDQGKATMENAMAAFAALGQLENARASEISKLTTERMALESSLPPSLVALTEQVECAKRIREQLITYERWNKKTKASQGLLKRREEWKAFIDSACKSFENSEAALSTKITSNMEFQYKGMYATIAGGTHIVPNLQQQPGSVDVHLKLAEFFGLKNTAATPLLSESYRNAVAISIFLSAALQRKTAARFLVLDDVTSSFDAGHQFQLMEVLRTQIGVPLNPEGLQVIVLSHDGLLEKYFDRLGNTKEWHHQHLQGMPPQGSVMMQTQDAERLRRTAEKFLKAGQVKQAEPLLRQHLEHMLLQVIAKVSIPVPLDFAIKDHQKMVSNCLDAINHSIDLQKAAGRLKLTVQQQTDLVTIHVPSLVANWVNHYETATASSLDPYVLLGVLDSSEKFADSFKYDCSCLNPGTTIRRYYRTLAAKACSC